MASTIQIKRGTGSAVPTGLADGELAINLDNRKLYFGSGSTSVNDFTFGEITAEKYIVSSSVLYVTTSFSSGSTEFGNSADDTHTFTGNITASGNISSSGTITAVSASFSRLEGNSPLVIKDAVFDGVAEADIFNFKNLTITKEVSSSYLTVYKGYDDNPYYELNLESDGAMFVRLDCALNYPIGRVKPPNTSVSKAHLLFLEGATGHPHHISEDPSSAGLAYEMNFDVGDFLSPSFNTETLTVPDSGVAGANSGTLNYLSTLKLDNGSRLMCVRSKFDWKVQSLSDYSLNSVKFNDVVTSDITASGNISSSGTIQASLIKNTSIVDSDNSYVLSVNTGGGSTFAGNSSTATALTSGDKTVDGNLTVNGDVTIGDDGIINSPGNMSFRIDNNANEVGQKFSWVHNSVDVLAELDEGGNLILYGNQLGQPTIKLQQNTQSVPYGPPVLYFERVDVSSDNSDIGRIDFRADDLGGNLTTYAQILGQTEETGNGTEGGKITFKVASHDAELQTGLLIEDGDAEDEVDVTIGNTTTSLTTIAGNLSITSNITSSGNISSSGNFDLTGNANIDGDLDVDGTTNLDAVDIDGNVQLDGTLTVGVSGTGHDVTLFGETHGKFIKWDQSEDLLDIRSETNFGTGGTGVDVTFFGDTLGKYMKWDQSMDHLKLYDNTNLVFGTGVSNEADFDASIFWDTADLVIDSETDIKIVADGGSVIVTGEITSSGNISSSGTVTADRFIGSQLTMVPWNYYVSSNNSDELYIPQGGSQVEINSDQPYNFMLAPYDGKVRRLSVYYQTGDPGTLTARVRAAAAPFDLDDADDIVQELTQTSVVDDTAYFFDFDASFSKGEAVAVTLEAASHAASSYVVGCIAVEYDTTT
jgi:hypothetical protein